MQKCRAWIQGAVWPSWGQLGAGVLVFAGSLLPRETQEWGGCGPIYGPRGWSRSYRTDVSTSEHFVSRNRPPEPCLSAPSSASPPAPPPCQPLSPPLPSSIPLAAARWSFWWILLSGQGRSSMEIHCHPHLLSRPFSCLSLPSSTPRPISCKKAL